MNNKAILAIVISLFFTLSHAATQDISISEKAISVTVNESWSMISERKTTNEEMTFKSANNEVIILTYNKEMIPRENANVLKEDQKPDLKIIAIAPQLNPTYHSDSIIKIRNGDAYKVKAYFDSQGVECQIMVLMGYYDIGFWQVSFIGRKEANWDNFEALAKTIKIKSP